MSREIIIDHKDIQDPQKVTKVTTDAFKKQGLNVHVNEVEHLEDDMKKGVRRLQVKNTQYHFGGFGEGTGGSGKYIYDENQKKVVKVD